MCTSSFEHEGLLQERPMLKFEIGICQPRLHAARIAYNILLVYNIIVRLYVTIRTSFLNVRMITLTMRYRLRSDSGPEVLIDFDSLMDIVRSNSPGIS